MRKVEIRKPELPKRQVKKFKHKKDQKYSGNDTWSNSLKYLKDAKKTYNTSEVPTEHISKAKIWLGIDVTCIARPKKATLILSRQSQTFGAALAEPKLIHWPLLANSNVNTGVVLYHSHKY